ncbi:SRPBCC family protein [Sphingomonas morindae]|uniref:SRPBCC family protein n=1 Tax=Sphingomonas morindae TaxID=1541170 RepID=A0ABY4X5D3_9SPHN|nr:SRPBCC family protein [Sphingomonas morindae]USI72086.1 SRPBCC family protein [Sphingomonas morindae]
MSDTIATPRGDDAPAAAAKSSAGRDAATEALIEAKGDHLVGRSVTIARPAAELYAAWRDFARLADFLENVERIDVLDDTRSHWVVKAPGGGSVEWDARITEDVPDRLIAWTSEPGADVPNSGRITFADAGKRGTVVTAEILYDPPAGMVGKLIAKIFQREPAIQARRDLRRFKQLMETGEIATNAMNKTQLEEEGR